MSEYLHPEGQRRFLHAQFHQIQSVFFKPRHDKKSCWRCRDSHTKCDGDPMSQALCGRCAASSGNLGIPCRRGLVCEPQAEIPFVCHLGQGPKYLRRVQDLPTALQDGAILLSKARWRRANDRARASKSEMRGSYSALFWSVVNTKVPNINTGPPSVLQNMKELDMISVCELPYDQLIIKIVWELEDNQEAARIMGISSVEHLVAFLEAASLCESEFGHHDHKRRLVYSAMQHLLHCLEALRLSDPRHNLLGANTHAYCTEANECICPAFHGLTRYAVRYAEALTMTFFSKKKGDPNHWLPVFYSLCLQANIRCVLMTLEARLGPVQHAFNNMGTPEHQQPLRSVQYMASAVSLFQQIPMQSNSKLAKKIHNALVQVQPSVYLREANSSASGVTWKSWRDVDDIKEYLCSIFSVTIPFTSAATTMHHHAQYISSHTAQGDSGASSNPGITLSTMGMPGNATVHGIGANLEMVMIPQLSNWANTTPNPVVQSKDMAIANANCNYERSVRSADTATIGANSSDSWTMDTRSIAETVASSAATIVPNQALVHHHHPMDQLAQDNTCIDNLMLDYDTGIAFDTDFSLEWNVRL